MRVWEWLMELMGALEVNPVDVVEEETPRVQALLERVVDRLEASGEVREVVWSIGPCMEETVEKDVVMYFRSLEAQTALREEWAEMREVQG